MSRIESSGLGVVRGGTFYPMLRRLESAGLVTSSWDAGSAGPARRMVSITPAGIAESRSAIEVLSGLSQGSPGEEKR
ncbi:PadR family transcriptional regulator [Austwickia chelonae]|uniref:PadR family transcriptional regulator n=1 Tax=Austwickia chelonae TaxID=100225 RepID=UPI003D31D166